MLAESSIELTCEEKLEALQLRCSELEDALKQANLFRTARDMQGPIKQTIWLPVMSLVEIFHEAYQIRNHALANNNSNLKLMFTVSNEGRIVGVSQEEESS